MLLIILTLNHHTSPSHYSSQSFPKEPSFKPNSQIFYISAIAMAFQKFIYLSAVVLSTLSLAKALPSTGSFKTADQVSNYTIVPWVWKGQVSPGGAEVELEVDTLSELVPKIKSVYPDYVEPVQSENSTSIAARAAQYPSVSPDSLFNAF
jgi:hypothetical protein